MNRTPTQQRVVELVENDWQNRRVLVIGDVMLDKYVWGNVERISPEAPVPIVHGSRSTHCPGGAANVAMNLVGLGAKATVVGFVGGDEDANSLRKALDVAGVDASLIASDGFPTTSKMRILSSNQQMLRIDFEKSGKRPETDYEKLIHQAREVMPTCSAVVLSDYAKGVLNNLVCAVIINDARTLGIPVLVDPKSPTFEKYRDATTVCPNLKELSHATGESPTDLEKLFDVGERFVEQYGFDFLTVTLAEKGIAILGKGKRKQAPAVAKQVFDVSGAGDTVIATLTLCLASGLEIETAIEVANVAAGIVVSKVGTVPVEQSELIGALSQDVGWHADEKVIPRARLKARAAAWRSDGQRIVFTNGCYDLLHVGHVKLIERAKQQGDKLIVAINSDESVRRLKGPTRPMVGEQERARVLAALSAIDAVVVFDESTPLEIIKAIRPDVLVKGGDYTEETVVGAPEVRSWGGRVCLVPLVQGFSTTELVSRAAQSVA
jgi:D-beta-D-heptose 7-phosphate kinase / D-beta-D-heptose 1-phosphate adenosyltransferase